MKKSTVLYSTTDVQKVRKKLLDEQGNRCALTGLKIEPSQAVLDHDHSSDYVRAVLHRQSNAVLGKIENLWNRYLSWWYNDTLSSFLRKAADYLDKNHPEDYIHPGWRKKVQSKFKSLKSAQQIEVLKELYKLTDSTILTDKKSTNIIRLKQFNTLILKRNLHRDTILSIITRIKDS